MELNNLLIHLLTISIIIRVLFHQHRHGFVMTQEKFFKERKHQIYDFVRYHNHDLRTIIVKEKPFLSYYRKVTRVCTGNSIKEWC